MNSHVSASKIHELQLLSLNAAFDALMLQMMELTRRKMEIERRMQFIQANTKGAIR